MTPSTKDLLPAPSVKEADGDFLRPDMMPLGPTVAIIYPDKRAGDRITLTWDGGPSSDGRWVGVRTLTADDEDVVFHVDVLVLMAAEAVSASYVVKRVGSDIDEPSRHAAYAVRNYTPLRIVRVLDHAGNPVGQIDHTSEWFDVELSLDFTRSLQAGDEV